MPRGAEKPGEDENAALRDGIVGILHTDSTWFTLHEIFSRLKKLQLLGPREAKKRMNQQLQVLCEREEILCCEDETLQVPAYKSSKVESSSWDDLTDFAAEFGLEVKVVEEKPVERPHGLRFICKLAASGDGGIKLYSCNRPSRWRDEARSEAAHLMLKEISDDRTIEKRMRKEATKLYHLAISRGVLYMLDEKYPERESSSLEFKGRASSSSEKWAFKNAANALKNNASFFVYAWNTYFLRKELITSIKLILGIEDKFLTMHGAVIRHNREDVRAVAKNHATKLQDMVGHLLIDKTGCDDWGHALVVEEHVLSSTDSEIHVLFEVTVDPEAVTARHVLLWGEETQPRYRCGAHTREIPLSSPSSPLSSEFTPASSSSDLLSSSSSLATSCAPTSSSE